jgi:hypothetical protein
MNMFRDILMMALVALGLGLWFGQPEGWRWPDACGSYVVMAVTYCTEARPYSIVLCGALALALFMTRLRY